MQNILNLSVERLGGSEAITFSVIRQFNAGWVGRDRDAVQHHIDELGMLGVPPPKHVPTLFTIGNHMVTTADDIQVHGQDGSGEVEWVLLKHRGELFIGVGSDHTDRKLEIHSVPKAKNLCLNVMAPVVWPYAEVQNHFDQLVLSCQVERNEKSELYQEAACETILSPDYWLDFIPRQIGVLDDGFLLFSGTIGTIAGLLVGDAYNFSLIDPVLNRRIGHRYTCPALLGGLEDY